MVHLVKITVNKNKTISQVRNQYSGEVLESQGVKNVKIIIRNVRGDPYVPETT
jgi:hypothetical protein